MTDATPNTRRDFLKTSSAAAIGAGLLGSLSRNAFAAGDETIKIGIVGCGGRGTGATSQALSTARDANETAGPVKLVAMGDAFADHLESKYTLLKTKFGDQVQVDDDHKFTGFDAYKKVIASDVDLVILATPPGFRPIHFEAAVAAGKNVFMEKPVAVDAPGIRKVLAAVKAAKEKDLKVGVGLQRHHQWHYMEALKRIHDGAIGDVLATRVYWNSGGVWDPRKTREECSGEMEYQMRNWYYYNWLCGDHINEQHIHNLDVGNWIQQDFPIECMGMGGREVRKDKKYGEIFDHFAVEYSYENGSKMFSQCRHQRGTKSDVNEFAHGTKGGASLDGNTLAELTGENAWSYGGRRAKRNDPYQTEHDDLFNAIRKNQPYNEGEYGAMSTLTAIMGRMAAYTGQVVTRKAALESEVDLMPEKFAWDAMPKNLPNENGEYAIPIPGITKTI